MNRCRSSTCQATAAHFDKKVAEDDLQTYRTQGLDKRARRLVEALGLALTYPRNRPDIKLWIGFENFRRRLARDDFRAFVHPPREMATALQASGRSAKRILFFFARSN